MHSKLITFTMIILATMACTSNPKSPEKWDDKELNEWFVKKEWAGGWNVTPDPSIDKKEFAAYYHKNPRHWNQAFQFLKSADLKNLPLGKQELEGEHLFVTVSEYYGKQKEEAKFEAHRKYIDIQYVIQGEELIGLTTHDKVEVTEPYNEEKDIEFYRSEAGDYLRATPENFFLFFPDDVHRPSITTGDSVLIKKLVVKILID